MIAPCTIRQCKLSDLFWSYSYVELSLKWLLRRGRETGDLLGGPKNGKKLLKQKAGQGGASWRLNSFREAWAFRGWTLLWCHQWTCRKQLGTPLPFLLPDFRPAQLVTGNRKCTRCDRRVTGVMLSLPDSLESSSELMLEVHSLPEHGCALFSVLQNISLKGLYKTPTNIPIRYSSDASF